MAGVARATRGTTFSNSSAPIVCRDVVVVGASVHDGPSTKEWPRGDVTGFDVRTGKRLWTFRSIPEKGASGLRHLERRRRGVHRQHQRLDDDVGRRRARASSTCPSARRPTTSTAATGPGANLFAESIVAVDARTGARKWHFQAVHHGVWDYDLPAAPALVDITVDGRRIQAAGPGEQAGLHLRARSPYRHAGLADRRAAGAAVVGARRALVPDAAVPVEAAGLRAPGPDRRQPHRLHARAAPAGHRGVEALRSRAALHAALGGRGDSAAGLGGRRQLGRRGLRSGEPSGCSCRR